MFMHRNSLPRLRSKQSGRKKLKILQSRLLTQIAMHDDCRADCGECVTGARVWREPGAAHCSLVLPNARGDTCIHTCIHTYIYTCTHTYMHACIHTYTYAWILMVLPMMHLRTCIYLVMSRSWLKTRFESINDTYIREVASLAEPSVCMHITQKFWGVNLSRHVHKLCH